MISPKYAHQDMPVQRQSIGPLFAGWRMPVDLGKVELRRFVRGLTRVGQDDLTTRDTGFDQRIDQGLIVDIALDDDPIAYQTGHEAGIHNVPVAHVADRYDGEDLPIGAAQQIAVPVQRPAGVALHGELQPVPQGIHRLTSSLSGSKMTRFMPAFAMACRPMSSLKIPS